MIRWQIAPGGCLRGTVRVPGDKSVSHRALMLAAIASGQTRIRDMLAGEDVLATLAAMQALGVDIVRESDTVTCVQGVGGTGLRTPVAALDLGNSGTSMRLLSGLLAGAGVAATLTGDASLQRRPMRRVTEPLALMGADIGASETGTAPLRIRAGQRLRGIDYTLPVASAQVKSALLLAGLFAEGRTRVTEPAPTRDHTERMLAHFGVRLEHDGSTVGIHGGQRLVGADIRVPADLSSAAFFLVGASIAPGSDLLLRDVGMNPTRTGVLDILRAMGARIDVLNPREFGTEPVADLHVTAAPLRGIAIPEELVPLAIDEFPVLLVAAACAEGETVLTGAGELRFKESDRIGAVATALQALGIDAEPRPDGMRVRGGRPHAGTVNSHGDHRIAMAFAIAALAADGPVRIDDCANVATSFPGFEALAGEAGLVIEAAAG